MKLKFLWRSAALFRTLFAAYVGVAGFSPLYGADKRAADRDWVDRRIDNAIADAIRNMPGIAEGNEFAALLDGKADRAVFSGPASISNIPAAVALSFEVTRCTNVALMVMSSSSSCVPSNTVFAWNVDTGRFENPTNASMPYIERVVSKTVSVSTNAELVVKAVTNTSERLVAHAANGLTYAMSEAGYLYYMHNMTNFLDRFSFILVTVPDSTRDAILAAGGVLSARSNAHRLRADLDTRKYYFDEGLWNVSESISIGTIEWIGADGEHHVFYGQNRTITFNMAEFAGELDPANLVSSVWFRQLKRWGVTNGNEFLTDEYGNTMTLSEFMELTSFKDAAARLYQAYIAARKTNDHKDHIYMEGSCVCEYARLKLTWDTGGLICTDESEHHVMGYSDPEDEESCLICVENPMFSIYGGEHVKGCGKKNLPGGRHAPAKTHCGCDCGFYPEDTEYLQYHTNAKPDEDGGSCWCHCGQYHVYAEESACEGCCKWCGKKMDDSGDDGTHTQSETKCRSCKCADEENAPCGIANASDADMEELGWHHRQKPENERNTCGCQCGTVNFEHDGDKSDFHYFPQGEVKDAGDDSSCWCFCKHRHERKQDEEGWCEDVCSWCGDKRGTRFGAAVAFDNSLTEADVGKHKRMDEACGCKCGAIVCTVASCSPFATSEDMHYIPDGECTCSCAGAYHVKVDSEFCPKVCGYCHMKSKVGPLGFDVADDETSSLDHDPDDSDCGCQCYNHGGESGGYGYGGFLTYDILRFHQRGSGSCRCKCNGSAFHWPITDGSCDAVCANCGYASEDSTDSEGAECQKRREATIDDHTPHESKCGCKCQDNDGRKRGAPGDGAYSGVFRITKDDSGDAYVAFHEVRKEDLHCTCKCGAVHHAEWEHKTCGEYEWDQCTEIDTHIKKGTTENHEYADGYLNDAVHYCKCAKRRTQAHVKVTGTQRTEPDWIITPKSCSVPGCGWTAEDRTPCTHSWGEWQVSYQTALIVTYVRSCNVCGALETDTKYLPDLQMCDTNNNVHIPESDACGCKCGKYGQNAEASPDMGLHKWDDTEDANGVQICLCKCGRFHIQRSASTYMSNLGRVCGSICAYCKNKSGTGLDIGKADDALHTPCTASDGHCGCKCGYLTANSTNLEKFHIRKAGTCRCLGSDGSGGSWHFRMVRANGRCQNVCECTTEFSGEHVAAKSEKEPITPRLATVTDHTKVSGSMCGCECRKYRDTNWQSWINLANFHNSDPNHCGCFCGHASESQIDPYHKKLSDSYCECMCQEHKVISHVWDSGHCECNCQYHDKQHQKINSGKCTAVCHGECGEASRPSKKKSHTPHAIKCGCECQRFLGESYPDSSSYHKLTGNSCMCDCETYHLGFTAKQGCPQVCAICRMNYERTDSGASIHSFGNRCVCGCGDYTRSHVWSDPPAKELITTYTCDVCEETIRVYRYTIHCMRDCDATDSWTGEEGHDSEDHNEPSGDDPDPLTYCGKHDLWYGGSTCPLCDAEDGGGSGSGSGQESGGSNGLGGI